MADMDVALLITRWIHVVAAACLLGGSLFVAMAMIPGTRAALDETTRARLHELVRKRWVPIVHGSYPQGGRGQEGQGGHRSRRDRTRLDGGSAG